MASKKDKRRHFVIGADSRTDGKARVTKGKDFLVAGGTNISHAETVDLCAEFSKRLKKEGHPDAATATEILREVLYDRRQRN
jgi:hypothetical protein